MNNRLISQLFRLRQLAFEMRQLRLEIDQYNNGDGEPDEKYERKLIKRKARLLQRKEKLS